MNSRKTRWATAAACVLAWAATAWADYDVRVDLKNLSGEAKTHWPVILRVYAAFGRDLPAASINPKGFHVYDPAGKEIPHMIEAIPPYDQLGNDEIVFVIDKIAPGQVLSYRITNTADRSAVQTRIDVVGSAHNLIANGSFDAVEDGRPAGFSPPAESDARVKHAGKASLKLTADSKTVVSKYAKPVGLRKDSWYYFGAWSKTDHVSRFGYQAGRAAHFRIGGFRPTDPKDRGARTGAVVSQCSTRDWLKTTFEYRGHTGWGMDIHAAKAFTDGPATVELVLAQRRHYYMDKNATRGTWWLDDAVFMAQPEVTVRFDLAVKALMRRGVFLFTRPNSMFMGRLKDENNHNDPQEWCAFPYAHERLRRLDAFALKGQRVSYALGVYHDRALRSLSVRLPDMALAGPGGAKIPVELVEYCPGYIGPDRNRYMQILNSADGVAPVEPKGDTGVRYLFLTFRVPSDAKPGRYAGRADVLVDGRTLQTVPVALRVQDLAQPAVNDVYVGLIFQSSSPRFDDEALEVYARSGFTCLTRFGGFLAYEKDPAGQWQVDLKALGKTMTWVKKHGIGAVCVFSDFDVGPRWDGGALLKRTRPAEFAKAGPTWGDKLKTAEAAYKAQIKRIEAARKKHPDWPTFIYMTFDEPNLRGGVNGKPEPAMGWVKQVAPNALTTLDVQFDPLEVCAKWYTMPAFDNPADWAGPELYRWVKKRSGDFGYCGQPACAEWSRYQGGMLMITTGARYFHGWHLQNANSQVAYDGRTKRLGRAISMIAWADGLNDLKCHRLLADAIAAAPKASDPKALAAAKAAREYLHDVFETFNGDHKQRWPIEPFLGLASDWGYDRFYDDWQEQMARHAAAIGAVKWID